jgi:hypothetical protein
MMGRDTHAKLAMTFMLSSLGSYYYQYSYCYYYYYNYFSDF